MHRKPLPVFRPGNASLKIPSSSHCRQGDSTMRGTRFGAEGMTRDDEAYRGSRFADVRDALFANPYQKVWGRAGEPALPRYVVTNASVLRGVLPFTGPYFFRQATARTVD